MKPTELVQLYFDYHNAGDVAGVMTLYDEDAVFEMVGNYVRRGTKELREMESFDASVRENLVVTDMKEINGQVHCQVNAGSDLLKSMNIPSIRYAGCVFAVNDDTIERVTAVLSLQSARELEKATILQPDAVA
ncbi:MAG: nuclear transport factor 2 family protein [Chloroflexota bacterium]